MTIEEFKTLHLLLPSYLRVTGTTLAAHDSPKFRVRIGPHEAFAQDLELSGEQYYLLSVADGSSTTQELLDRVAEAFGTDTTGSLTHWIDAMVDRGLLTFAERSAAVLPHRRDRYARHTLYFSSIGADPALAQERLRRARVTLLGVGGIGTWMSYLLTAAGVGHLRLVDGDIIEESNLTRQVLFTPDDLGRPKVEVAAERLRAQRSDLTCETHPHHIQDEEDLERAVGDASFVVLCANSPAQMNEWMDRYAVRHRVPWLRAGYAHTAALCGPLLVPGVTACQACVSRGAHEGYLDDLPLADEINRRSQVASFGPINGIAASIAANEVVSFLGGINPRPGTFGAILALDALTLEAQRLPVERDPSCPRCSHLFADERPLQVARAS